MYLILICDIHSNQRLFKEVFFRVIFLFLLKVVDAKLDVINKAHVFLFPFELSELMLFSSWQVSLAKFVVFFFFVVDKIIDMIVENFPAWTLSINRFWAVSICITE